MLSILLNFLSFEKSESKWWWYTPLIPAAFGARGTQIWVWGQPRLQSKFPNTQRHTGKPCLEGGGRGGRNQNQKGKKSETSSPMLTISYHPPKSHLFFCCKIIRMHYYAHLTPYQSYINTELYIHTWTFDPAPKVLGVYRSIQEHD